MEKKERWDKKYFAMLLSSLPKLCMIAKLVIEIKLCQWKNYKKLLQSNASFLEEMQNFYKRNLLRCMHSVYKRSYHVII